MREPIRRAAAALALIAVTVAAAAERKVIPLTLAQGHVRGVKDDTVRMKQGDDVELRWSSDRPVTLHLHGYEIEARVVPGKPAVMSFNAKIPGRFPVHEHAEGAANHRPVLYVEVYP